MMVSDYLIESFSSFGSIVAIVLVTVTTQEKHKAAINQIDSIADSATKPANIIVVKDSFAIANFEYPN